MMITCPFCHQVCETDSEIEVGQRVQCPFCDGKFTYGEESLDEHSHYQEVDFCTSCGAQLGQGSLFCSHCGHKIDSVKEGINQESVTQKSKGKKAQLWRVLKKGAVCLVAVVFFIKGCASIMSDNSEQDGRQQENESYEAWAKRIEATARIRAIEMEQERQRAREQKRLQPLRDVFGSKWQCQNCGKIRAGKPST